MLFLLSLFHFRYYSLVLFCQTSGQPFCRRVFIKDKMIHIHVWSTAATHVRTRRWKIKTWDWKEKKKRTAKQHVNHVLTFQCSRFRRPQEITTCWGCEIKKQGDHSSMDHRLIWALVRHGQKKLEKRQCWSKYESFCLSIALRKSGVPLTFKTDYNQLRVQR